MRENDAIELFFAKKRDTVEGDDAVAGVFEIKPDGGDRQARALLGGVRFYGRRRTAIQVLSRWPSTAMASTSRSSYRHWMFRRQNRGL